MYQDNIVLCGASSYEQKYYFNRIARGINAGGELLVERADGTVEEVNSGEVSVRGLYSYV